MRNLSLTLLHLSLLSLSSQALADVYKYQGPEGKIHFTDTPVENPAFQLIWHKTSIQPQMVVHGQSLLGRGSAKTASAPAKTAAPVFQASWSSEKTKENRQRFARYIDEAARKVKLRPELLHAVVMAESAYDPQAESSAGAQGLMQLMPGTAKRYGVADSFDPQQNISGGAKYLRDLLKMFDFDLNLALAGYNAGENAVIRHGNSIPPYEETQNYVKKVLGYYQEFRIQAAIAGQTASR
ncbi:MAG: lytic transglycosylase domain-containing protein [Gammaproteobacteria bacterium]|nr:lytic transglycosylase domain-containing protein [Gammaproteobacteria bacterium]